MSQTFLDESYDDYPRTEAAFQAALDESLHPRGPELLYETQARPLRAGRG